MSPFDDEDIYLTTPPLLPVAPLLDAFHDAGYTSQDDIAAAVGISQGTISRTQQRGTINVWMADHIAIRCLNTHPVAVYGDTWFDAAHYRAGRADAIFEELTGLSGVAS